MTLQNKITQRLNNIVDELVVEVLKESLETEERVVKFRGEVYPKFGQAVILAGGSGSGKGFVQSSGIIPLDAKVFDVDKLKELYLKAQERGKIDDPKNYDMRNPEDVSALHLKVRQKGYQWKQKDMFFDDDTRDPSRLPNVIFDITGKDEDSIRSASIMCRGIGYENITLVWVVVNRSRAMWQNLSRDRQVSQSVFHSIHNSVNQFLPDFIKNTAGRYVDNVWLVFNSGETLGQKTEEEKKNTAVSLEPNGNGFDISKEDEERLMRILGENEPNPSNPQKYKSFDDVLVSTTKDEKTGKTYPAPNPEHGHRYKGSATYKK